MLNRRHFIISTATLFSPPLASAAIAQTESEEVEPVVPVRQPVSPRSKWPIWDARVTPANYDPFTSNPWGFDPRYLPQIVEARDNLVPGDIHVDAIARYLYHIQDNGTAMRYGVAIGRGNLYEPGVYTIRRKVRWPTWRPTDAMIERDPAAFSRYKDGVDGGPTNPLGSRALYLYVGNRDTYLRIHGTPSPQSIGSRASSGCVRMVMAHIIGLFDQVELGATATLYPAEDGIQPHS